MKKIFAVIAALFLSAAPAAAQSANGLTFVPLGYCQLTSVNTAVLLSSCVVNGTPGIPKGATRAIMMAEAQVIRYRDDGTTPTTTVGMPIQVTQTVTYTGTLTKVQVIGAVSGGILNVLFYR